MAFDPILAAIRFGMGRHPDRPDPSDIEGLLNQVSAPDRIATRYPIPSFNDVLPDWEAIRAIKRDIRKTGERTDAHRAQVKALQRKDGLRKAEMFRHAVARGLETEAPFRERLVRFWADHFTAKGRGGITRNNVSTYVEDAIRPHVAGSFAEMLKAAITHPIMLNYLDQSSSVGPNSSIARNNPKRGLNENLAREVLELHTLGVGAGYSQTDVTELAELFAGMLMSPEGFKFMPGRGEPGPEIVLGKSYGARKPAARDIFAVLDDLAVHPETALHIARKLAVHFVSDDPDERMVADMAQAFARTDGDLMTLYGVMLDHTSAFARPLMKAKQPFDYMVSAMRALAVPGTVITELDLRDTRRGLQRPLALMGQPWELPVGPDGWPEDEAHWVTPQGLAARIQWALGLTEYFAETLPDPRELVERALGDLAGDRIRFAAKAAETRAEGVALVLVSPDFQKR